MAVDLSTKLLNMIEAVNQAPHERSAITALLQPLISQFDMDQAVLCELSEDSVQPIFAIDRTRRVLNPAEDRLLLSRTLMQQAINTMEPATHINRIAEETPSKSINDLAIRCLVCIPISRQPARVVLLASQRNPLRIIDSSDLTQIKTATKAAILAFQQRHSLQSLREQNARLQGVLDDKMNFVYASSVMDSLAKEAAKLAPYNVNLFLFGESGAGKEELAKEIHRLSGRNGKFVAVNCANLSEGLLESELFGFVKGAFTGAFQSKRGLLEEGNRGTFFLDEIGDLPLSLQAKLLRVIQERCFRPLGATKDTEIDIRFLSASHKNLQALVEQGKFREDLFYRIQEASLAIPPLRERSEDTEILAHHFVQQFAREFQLGTRRLNSEALQKLLSHSWPGNIRELKNVCKMAVILAAAPEITAEHVKIQALGKTEENKMAPKKNPAGHTPATSSQTPSLNKTAPSPAMADANKDTPKSLLSSVISSLEKSGNLRNIVQDFERELILNLLGKEGATQITVAGQLGISVRTLQRAVNRPGLENIQAH